MNSCKFRNKALTAFLPLIVLLVSLRAAAGTAEACQFCGSGGKEVEAKVHLSLAGDRLSGLAVQWFYNEALTKYVLFFADENLDGQISPAEMEGLKRSLQEELRRSQYFFNALVNGRPVQAKGFDNMSLSLREGRLLCTFDVLLDKEIGRGLHMKVWFDEPAYRWLFFFAEEPLGPVNQEEWRISHQLQAGRFLTFEVQKPVQAGAQALSQTEKGKPGPFPQSTGSGGRAGVQPAGGTDAPSWLQQRMTDLRNRLTSGLKARKAGEGWTPLMFILGVSFLYGMAHAAGPGHGKALISSYLLAHRQSYGRTGVMALGVGGVHVLTGLGVAVLFYFFLNAVVVKTLEQDLSLYTARISGGLIVLVALWLLYLKRAGRSACHGHDHAHDHTREQRGSRHTAGTIVVAAGLVPCPGLVGFFLFCMALEMYLEGVLSAVAMSLGVALVMLGTAWLTVAARQAVLFRAGRLRTVLEYSGVVLILALGLTLLLLDPRLFIPTGQG